MAYGVTVVVVRRPDCEGATGEDGYQCGRMTTLEWNGGMGWRWRRWWWQWMRRSKLKCTGGGVTAEVFLRNYLDPMDGGDWSHK